MDFIADRIIRIKKYIPVLVVFLASRIFFFIIMQMSTTPMSAITFVYDGMHYNTIAQEGYSNDFLVAFFPLIPLCIRYLGHFGTLTLNGLAALGSACLLYKMTNCDKRTKLLIALIFLFSPISFFSMVEYTESLFFFFTLFAFYLFRKKQNWLLMGICIGLSVCTRNMGSMLFFAIFIGMVVLLFQKKIKIKAILTAYIPATLLSILYPLYLQIHFGNWKYFVDVQYLYWHKVKASLWGILKWQYKILTTHYFNEYYEPVFRFNEVMTLVVLGLLIFFMILSIKKRKMNVHNFVLILYVLFSIFAINSTMRDPLLHTPTASYYRYYFGVFPIFFWLENCKKKFLYGYFVVMIIFTAIASYYFLNEVFFF